MRREALNILQPLCLETSCLSPAPGAVLYAKLLCELRPSRRLKQSSVATLWPHQDCGQCLHTFSCSKERTCVELLH